MTNVVDFKFSKSEKDGFSEAVPESATLLQLCSMHPVRVKTVEHDGGETCIIAYFDHTEENGETWTNYYMQCQGAARNHLFVWSDASEPGEFRPLLVVERGFYVDEYEPPAVPL